MAKALLLLCLVASAWAKSGFDRSVTDPVESTPDQVNNQMVRGNKRLLSQLANIQGTFAKIAADQRKADKALAIHTTEEKVLEGKVADLKALKEKMVAVTEDFDAWAAPQTTKIDKVKAEIKALQAEINNSKKKRASLQARLTKARDEMPKVQAEIDAAMAQLKARGEHGLTGTYVDADALKASESDEDDTAAMLIKSEEKSDKEAAQAAQASKAGKTDTPSKKGEKGPKMAAKKDVVAAVNKTGSMSSADQPCCVAHKGPLCIQKDIAQCVCKFRQSCCTKAWDLACVDTVIEQGCGMCSAATLSASPLSGGKLQTGGRREGQVYLK